MFVHNVDPLTKLVHVPSLQPRIERAVVDMQSTPKSFEALLFAIYSAAVMSLKEGECKQCFNEPRKALLSRYTSATKAALSRAKFMGTANLVVLQALVLHIISVRDIYDPRTLWTLSGIAMRIAECMGLQRDGSTLHLPPFESEIRRRIWWQLKMNDARTAEMTGLPKFRGFFGEEHSPHPPANVNDDELYYGMPALPTESTRVTDMIFCVVRSEFPSLLRRFSAKIPQYDMSSRMWDKYASKGDMKGTDDLMTELEENLETKYLRYCDPSNPLQLMVMLVARSAMNVGRFVAHHPRRWASEEQTPESERQHVWNLSIKLLEQYNMMQSIPRFSWHAAYFMQWNSFIHILDTLLARPLKEDAAKTWQSIDSAYESTPEMVSNMKKPIHVAVGNLCLKAWAAREAALKANGQPVLNVPEYIIQLRKQREEASNRRQLRRNQDKVGGGRPGDAASGQPMNTTKSITAPLEPNALPQLTNADQPQDSNIASWYNDGVDDGLFGMPASMMDMDSYYMLAQNNNLEGTTDQYFDWA